MGDSIQGIFKTEVTYPRAAGAEPQRTGAASFRPEPRTSSGSDAAPGFADPGLETLLEEKGVVIKPALDESGPVWFKLLWSASAPRCC